MFKFFVNQYLLKKLSESKSRDEPSQDHDLEPLDFSHLAASGLSGVPPEETKVGGEGDSSCDDLPSCAPLEIFLYAVQQAALLMLLFYFINICGVVQVMVMVPYQMLATIYSAPTIVQALKKNTEYARDVLLVSIFSHVISIFLQMYVLDYLPIEEVETAIFAMMPQGVADAYECMCGVNRIFFE
jgi:hypothetical protein